MSGPAWTSRPPALDRVTLLAYGSMGLPLAFVALPIYVHVPALYAHPTGMSLAAVGAVLLLTRLWDAVIDPVLGVSADRYLAGMRGRKLALLLAAPLLLGGLAALLRPPLGSGAGWLAGALMVVYLGYSLASVNHQAWGAELTGDAPQRTRLTACREAFALVGVMLAATLPGALGNNLQEGLAQLVWVFAALLMGALIASTWGVPRTLPHAGRVVATWSGVWRVLHRPRFRALLLVFAVSGVAAAIPASLVLFFVADVLRADNAGGIFLALYFLSAALGLPLWVVLARRLGRVKAWGLGMVLALIALSWASGLHAGQTFAFGVICVVSGFALGADLTLPASLLAEISAHDNDAGAATYFGWWNTVAKLNLALAAGLALPALEWLGYAPGDRGEEAARLLAYVYSLLPAGLKLLAFVLLWKVGHRIEGKSSS